MADTQPINENMQLLNLLLGASKMFTSSGGAKVNETNTVSGPGSLGGSVTTEGGTETKQTMMSQEGINAMLQRMMEDDQGLAQVASGSKAPGMYNSTTRNLLLNDLMARSAAEVAMRTAPTVTTKAPTTVTETKTNPNVRTESRVSNTAATPAPLGKNAGTAGLAGLAAMALMTDSGKKLLESAGKGISSMFGGDAAAASAGVIPAAIGGSMSVSDMMAAAYGGDEAASFTGMLQTGGNDYGVSDALDYASSSVADMAADIPWMQSGASDVAEEAGGGFMDMIGGGLMAGAEGGGLMDFVGELFSGDDSDGGGFLEDIFSWFD